MDSNHRPPGPEPGALARLSHAPNSIAGNPGAGGSKAPQRASAPAINCEFSITLGSACRIGRGARQGSAGNIGGSDRRLLEKRHPVLSVGSLGPALGVCSMRENSEGVIMRYTTLELDCDCGQHTPLVREAGFTADQQVGIPGRVTFRLAGSAQQTEPWIPQQRSLFRCRCRRAGTAQASGLVAGMSDRLRDNLLSEQRGEQTAICFLPAVTVSTPLSA